MELYEKPIHHIASLPFFPLSNHSPFTTFKCSNLKAEPVLNHLIKMQKKLQKHNAFCTSRCKKEENNILKIFDQASLAL